jgi:hypothetical protein
MNSLIRYGLAGLMFFGAGISVEPGVRLQEQIAERAAPQIKPATASPDSVPSVDKAISNALASHGNTQAIPLSFFTDLVRTMEKSGFEREAAVQVAVTLAKNPKLDNLAGLTVAGSLQGYQETTRENLAEALSELVTYIEQPDRSSGRANEMFGLISPDLDRLIGEKIGNGNEAAAQLLMEQALLRRFNPALAARIFVPSDRLAPMPPAADRVEPTEQRRSAPIARMLANTSKRSASRRIVSQRNVQTRQHLRGVQHAARINSPRKNYRSNAG